jgi:hypothetical protein
LRILPDPSYTYLDSLFSDISVDLKKIVRIRILATDPGDPINYGSGSGSTTRYLTLNANRGVSELEVRIFLCQKKIILQLKTF